MQRIPYEAVRWELDPVCNLCRRRSAVLLFDGQLSCVECADELLERMAALELAPALRGMLPALAGERVVKRPAASDTSQAERYAMAEERSIEAMREELRRRGIKPCFGTCFCGRPIYEHSRVKVQSSWEYRCSRTSSGRYQASDGSEWPVS